MLDVAVQRLVNGYGDVAFLSFFVGMLSRYAKASSEATARFGLARLGIAQMCPAGTSTFQTPHHE